MNNTIYDNNNNPQRTVPSNWTTNFEMSFKQPLLQGAGSLYNRIAGPFDPLRGIGTYLQYDGVIIARIRTDIRLADFEAGVRNFVSDVENAYWELYFAYRNVGAAKIGRDSALQTWRKVHALYVGEARGGEADKEAQSREQYFLFRGQLETALADVYARKPLRYMMGLAATDGRLIRPATNQPTPRCCSIGAKCTPKDCAARSNCAAKVAHQADGNAAYRVEELLLPRLDVLGTYRFLGVGQDLIDQPGKPYNPTAGSIRGTDAFSTWRMAISRNGNRATVQHATGLPQQLAAVRNAQLQLARERSILQDLELEVSHQLADAVRDVVPDYVLAQDQFQSSCGSGAQGGGRVPTAAYDAGTVTFDLLLEAQRHRSDARDGVLSGFDRLQQSDHPGPLPQGFAVGIQRRLSGGGSVAREGVPFHVDDFDAFLARAVNAGAKCEQKFQGGGARPPIAFCSDPFGNGFCVLGTTT